MAEDPFPSDLQAAETVRPHHLTGGSQRGQHGKHDALGEKSSEVGGQDLDLALGFGRLQGHSDLGWLYLCDDAVLQHVQAGTMSGDVLHRQQRNEELDCALFDQQPAGRIL